MLLFFLSIFKLKQFPNVCVLSEWKWLNLIHMRVKSMTKTIFKTWFTLIKDGKRRDNIVRRDAIITDIELHFRHTVFHGNTFLPQLRVYVELYLALIDNVWTVRIRFRIILL